MQFRMMMPVVGTRRLAWIVLLILVMSAALGTGVAGAQEQGDNQCQVVVDGEDISDQACQVEDGIAQSCVQVENGEVVSTDCDAVVDNADEAVVDDGDVDDGDVDNADDLVVDEADDVVVDEADDALGGAGAAIDEALDEVDAAVAGLGVEDLVTQITALFRTLLS